MNQFLKAQGISVATNADAPKYTKNAPVLVYAEEDLAKFFAKCNPRQCVIFKTFLMAGLRESELVFLTFDRLHLDRGVIRIDENPKYDFMPKAYQCRDVYIPPELVEELRKLKPMAGCDLVFPTRNCTPNHKLLIICKRIANKAGMAQDDWWLHRWRSTFAIRMRSGRCTWAKLDTSRFGITFGGRSKTIEAYESITSYYLQRWQIDSKAARSIKGRELRKSPLTIPP